MKERTKDLLKRAGSTVIVFLNGGIFSYNYHLVYQRPPTDPNSYQGSMVSMIIAFLLALLFGWLAIKPRKRSPIEAPFRQIPKGTRIGDAEGRIFIITEDIDIEEKN